MGVRPYKAFTFDGKSSLDYGVYLTGEGVFNAPERAVEMIEIPGRNGEYALDQGRFKNITVTYKAGMVDYSESDFATRVSDVRNWLCSKVGYCRLEDDYNPNEYRMAVYMSGIQVDHEDLQTGEFEITFDCKPQRWLTSGETAVSVANNGTITNPTRFDSQPTIITNGYGNFSVNEQLVNITSKPLGLITLSQAEDFQVTTSKTVTFDGGLMAAGDVITSSAVLKFEWVAPSGKYFTGLNPDIDHHSQEEGVELTLDEFDLFDTTRYIYHKKGFVTYKWSDLTFTKGTTKTSTETIKYRLTIDGSGSYYIGTVNATYSYNGSDTITYSFTLSNSNLQNVTVTSGIAVNETIADSSRQSIITPINIDMNTGEAYTEVSGSIVSVNSSVSFSNDLITLKAGVNTVKYDNTITSFQIVPRWWKV